MCGIIGVVGKKNVYPEIKSGLERVSYRGYDSSGIATISNNEFSVYKTIGHPETLPDLNVDSEIGIGHTRWASRGGITIQNSHPHFSNDRKIAVVHNGIVENYDELRVGLIKKGYSFYSETDTEIIPILLQESLQQSQDMISAIHIMSQKIHGAYALVILTLNEPDTIYCVRFGSPLCIGKGSGFFIISSDSNSILPICQNISVLENGRVAIVKKSSIGIRTLSGESSQIKFSKIKQDITSYIKEPYAHYMEKEIFEQPSYLRNALAGRILPRKSEIRLAGIEKHISKILESDEIIFTGCGSALYASQVGAAAMETIARKKSQAIAAGELQYYNKVITDKTVLIAVSQSGETADTIGCINNFKKHGAVTLGIINVVNSSISRLVDSGIYIRAGQETAVASTKAVLNQMITMIALAGLIGSKRDLAPLTYESLIKDIYALPGTIEMLLSENSIERIKKIADKYAYYDNMFCLARGILEPIAYETALKIKEISYIHAEGISGSEIKHGPLALISSELLTLAMIDSGPMEVKTGNNLNEIKSRGGKIIGIINKKCSMESKSLFDDYFEIPGNSSSPILKTIEFLVAGQLLGYYLAVARGCEIDRPRFLAKSLTIE